MFLNVCLSLRFPLVSPWWSNLLPSLDLVALALVLALCVAWLRVPRWVHGLLLAALLAARALRIADGIEQGAYLRNFNLSVDLPLLPELVRLFYATLSRLGFWLAALAVALLVLALALAMHWALRCVERGLREPSHVRAVFVGIGLLAIPAAMLPPRTVFGASILGRVSSELAFAASLPRVRARQRASIAQVQQEHSQRPSDLRKLRGQDVYLFVLESYGQCVLDLPELFARVSPEYRRFETELSGQGFQLASRVLDSSTYGGRSWLAQATLLTSVPTRDQLEYELLRAAQPRTIAEVFATAGYRTVLAQPGTVRESTQPDLYHFQQHYFARDFGYRGPVFGWATMPDQFVLDTLRRRELRALARRPLFLGYALVSSHVPWSDLPPLVDDWSTLGDGSLFGRLPSKHYSTQWLSLAGARVAYADSIVYDLEVLRRYISEFVHDDSLLIILGDHQPHSEVSQRGPSPGVPVHVLSRNGAFIDPFRARGYTPGMLASEALPHPPLASLMLDLMADFSVAARGGSD